MNQRDRLYVQREWLAWASWMRQGKTFPNALGYKSGTVEYALMRGETGGDIHAGSKVPDRFDCDRNVEILNKVFWNLPENTKNAISGVYLYREADLSRNVPLCHQMRYIYLYICIFTYIYICTYTIYNT